MIAKRIIDIAEARPVYIDFQNLFDILALSKCMKLKAPHEAVSLDLSPVGTIPDSKDECKRATPGRIHGEAF